MRQGFSLTVFQSILKQRGFELVISDMKMDNMNGLQLINRLSAESTARKLGGEKGSKNGLDNIGYPLCCAALQFRNPDNEGLIVIAPADGR